jgi:glutamate dehydrogenase
VAERGTDPADIVRAYRIARAVTGAAARWDAVERLEGVDRQTQAELMAGIDALVEAATRWYLAAAAAGELADTIAAGREGVERLAEALPALGGEERAQRRRQAVERLTQGGVPEPLARAHALAPELASAPDMVAVAAVTGRAIEEVAEAFLTVGAELRPDWLEGELTRTRAASRMQRWALQAVREDALQARRELAEDALVQGAGLPVQEAVARFLRDHGDACRRLAAFMRTLAREGDPDLAGLTLAVRQLRAIVE